MSKDENMHSLIPRKDVLHPATFFLQRCVSSGTLFSSPVPLLACVLRLQGFERNEWVIGTGTFAVRVRILRNCVRKYAHAGSEIM